MDYIDIIENIVDNLRYTKEIYDIVDNGSGSFTLVLSDIDNLELNKFVTLSNIGGGFDNENQKILSIDENNDSITIQNLNSPIIPGVISGTLKTNWPYFDYEHWKGECEILIEKGGDPILKRQKYPLIFLVLNNVERFGGMNLQNRKIVEDLNIFFVIDSEVGKRADWRRNNKFIPILHPLLDRFLIELRNSPYIISDSTIEGKKKDYYYFSTDKQEQNKLNDIVEATRLTLNELKYIESIKNCITL